MTYKTKPPPESLAKKYKYIEFHGGKDAKLYACVNSKQQAILGWIRYYSQWRSWTYWPSGGMVVLSAGCLNDIADFLKRLSKGEIE